MRRRIHWPGVVGILTTLGGVISLPEVLALLPSKTAAMLIAVGAVVQAVTRPVHKQP